MTRMLFSVSVTFRSEFKIRSITVFVQWDWQVFLSIALVVQVEIGLVLCVSEPPFT